MNRDQVFRNERCCEDGGKEKEKREKWGRDCPVPERPIIIANFFHGLLFASWRFSAATKLSPRFRGCLFPLFFFFVTLARGKKCPSPPREFKVKAFSIIREGGGPPLSPLLPIKIACFFSALLFSVQHRPGDISTKRRRIVKRGESFGDSSSPAPFSFPENWR